MASDRAAVGLCIDRSASRNPSLRSLRPRAASERLGRSAATPLRRPLLYRRLPTSAAGRAPRLPPSGRSASAAPAMNGRSPPTSSVSPHQSGGSTPRRGPPHRRLQLTDPPPRRHSSSPTLATLQLAGPPGPPRCPGHPLGWTRVPTMRTCRVFSGRPLNWDSRVPMLREAEALAAVRRFMEEHRTLPTASSWQAAGMSPSEKTIRRRFGSFRAAAERTGLA